MNVKLKKFEILEPKVKITTGLKTIIDNNRFTIQKLVENVSKSASSDAMIFSLYSDYLYSDYEEYFFTYYGSCQLGVYIIEFYDKFKYIDCGLYFYNSSSCTKRTGIKEWYITNTVSYTKMWYNADFLYNFYAYKKFTAHHPVYNDSEYLALGIEKKVHTVNRYKIGDVFNTQILPTDKAAVFLFNDGTYNLYKSDSNVDCTVTKTSDNTYNFDWSAKIAVLDDLKNQGYTSKTAISYSNTTGAHGITPSIIILSTFDIYDTNGNLIFAKNAKIEDYI